MDKIKSSICFSCCFRATDVDPQQSSTPSSSSLMQTSSTWIKSKTQELPELRGKCRGLMSKIGRNRSNRHHHSTDFRYDPFSYALNFDEGPVFDEDGEISPEGFRYRSFSSRLPASPPQPPPATTAAVVTA